MIFSNRNFNCDLRLYTSAFGHVICVDDLLKVYDMEQIDIVFATQQRIARLRLEYEEICLLGAFTMMFTGIGVKI